MKLRSKLAGSFVLVALITFCASLFAWWQSRKLGDALYEVGVVRLPSIQGLNKISESLVALEASHRLLFPAGSEEARVVSEIELQKSAWAELEDGWRIYEPLPQSPEEAASWQAFVSAFSKWRDVRKKEFDGFLDARRSSRGVVIPNQENKELYPEVVRLLNEVTRINYEIADLSKKKSLSSFEEMSQLHFALGFSALGGVFGAVVCGLYMGNQISKPVVQIADAMSLVARGDLSPTLAVDSTDEIGQMALAMNRMVEAMRRSEGSMRALGDNLPDGMICQLIREHQGGRRFVNMSAGVRRLLGLDPQALLADCELYFQQVIPDDQPVLAAAIASSLVSMTPMNVVLRMRRQDNEVRFMSLRAAPRKLANGDVLWDAFQTDITEQRLAEAELRSLKNHLQNMIDSMPAALVGLDTGLLVTGWNKQAARLTGLPADQAIGKPLAEVLPEFFTSVSGLYEKASDTGSSTLENLVMNRDGCRRVYDLMLYPLTTEGLRESVLRIDEVTERTKIQELMVQTEKMLSLGGLAAGMAHEVNNPLGIISQAAQNIERRMSPGLPANHKLALELGLDVELMRQYFVRREIPVFITDIREAVARAAMIVANMLQFSRKSGGDRQPTSLAGLLDRTVDLAANDYDLRKQFDFKAIQITKDYASDVPHVPVVMVEIQQVLLNLLKNAAQAMSGSNSQNQPRILLTLRSEPRYAVIVVEDNGPGMEAKVARRIFEPFFTTKPPGVGTGLGLSVSYTIVTQNHRGLISVDSAPGAGARFTIKLPILESFQA